MATVQLEKVTKRFGTTRAVDEVSFEVEQGTMVSLLGPSGCGKTTTLRLIAGFETPDEGRVLIEGQDMHGRKPYERNVGLLFQDYALFPHMSVGDNIAYGMRRRGMDRGHIRRRIGEMLELVKLEGYAERRPSSLSGGQQQRVALARAFAINPQVMLLDEPLSALDAKLRQELRVELKEILAAVQVTTIVVTHDQEEAMSLGEHLLVMNEGRIMQVGPPLEVYTRPVNRFVAEFVGRSNWFRGRLAEELDGNRMRFEAQGGFRLIVPRPDEAFGGRIEVCVRPERVEVLAQGEAGESGESSTLLAGRLVDVAHLGADVHLVIDIGEGHRLLAVRKSTFAARARTGDTVTVRFAAEDCILVAAEG